MKVIIVTSEITFVPGNYDQLIMGLAEIPEVNGLVVIRNRSFKTFVSACAAILSNAAPALGWQLIKNYFNSRMEQRSQIYRKHGKKFWSVDNINSEEFISMIQQENIDLVINARTRSIFGARLLRAPRLGCVNIHHGLLPEQRGLMCDFWAHAEDLPCGFTLHEMTHKIDDGRIIRRIEVPRSASGYLEYLGRSSLQELTMIQDFFKELRTSGGWNTLEHLPPAPFVYRKNPTIEDFYAFRKSGLII